MDANLTWADQSILTNPQRTLTVTPRVGHRWLGNLHPGRAFSIWAGASLEVFENASVGQVPFSLGAGPGGSLPLPSDFGTWLAGLPANQRASVGQLLAELIMLEQGNGQSTAAFNLNINPNKAWNMVLGGEMDLNKHWQLIAEAGLLGSRTTVAGNLCYRFGI